MFHDRIVCMVMLAWCCVVRGEEAAAPSVRIAESPAAVDAGGEVMVADLRKAVEEAAQKIRDRREELLQTSPDIKALSAAADQAKERLAEFIRSSDAYRDVTQRLARAEAALAVLETEGVKPPPGQLAKARGELNRIRLEKRRVEMGGGSGEGRELATAVTVANRHLQNGIASQPGMGDLMTAHSKALTAYQNALEIQARAAAGATNALPSAGEETPSPAPASGTP